MACSRKGCPHVMCDTYIDDVGYICWECKNDFEKWLEIYEYPPKTEDEIVKHLTVFMSIERTGYDNENEISVSEFFRKHSR